MKATEILNVLKTEKGACFVVTDEEGRVYCNQATDNVMDFYRHDNFYGVYSDVLPYGQVDSREHNDEDILKAIEKVISYDKDAKVIRHEEVTNGNRNYMY